MEEVAGENQWAFPIQQRDGVAIMTFPSDAYNRIDDPVIRATFLIQAQQAIEELIGQSQQPRLLINFDDVHAVTSGASCGCFRKRSSARRWIRPKIGFTSFSIRSSHSYWSPATGATA